MNKKRYIAFLALVGLATAPLLAQEGEYRYADASQLWRLTDFAAGLSHDSTVNRGYALFSFNHREGSYSRVQEGNRSNELEFQTERYQKVNPFVCAYGSFRFDMGRTFNRSWSDVMRTYHSNPFIPASPIPSKYDGQAFDFVAALGTTQMWGFTGGLRLDYKVGDLSRLRDPRSRSELLDYKLTPSLTYTTGASTFGLKGHYERRKEKIPNVSGLTDAPAIVYYQLTGMEAAEGTVDGYKSFSRQWVDHRLGAALAYGYNNGQLNSLTTLSIERGKESVQEAEKHEPGKFYSYSYALATRHRLKAGNLLHQLDLTAEYQQAYADEYKQQRMQTNDPETGLTSYHYETLIEYRKRYQLKTYDLALQYRLNFTDRQQAINHYVGLDIATSGTDSKHLLPTSTLKCSGSDFTLEGGTSLLGQRLFVDVQAGYHLSSKADLALPATMGDATYAQQVLLPDMDYYNANHWRGRVQLSCQFPLTVKGNRSWWFVRAYYEGLSAQHSLNRQTFGVSLGLFN